MQASSDYSGFEKSVFGWISVQNRSGPFLNVSLSQHVWPQASSKCSSTGGGRVCSVVSWAHRHLSWMLATREAEGFSSPLVAVSSSSFSYIHGPQLSRFENGVRNKIPESACHYLSKSLGNMIKSFSISHFSNVKTLSISKTQVLVRLVQTHPPNCEMSNRNIF